MGIDSPRTDIKSSTLLSDYSGMDLIPLVGLFSCSLSNLRLSENLIKCHTRNYKIIRIVRTLSLVNSSIAVFRIEYVNTAVTSHEF